MTRRHLRTVFLAFGLLGGVHVAQAGISTHPDTAAWDALATLSDADPADAWSVPTGDTPASAAAAEGSARSVWSSGRSAAYAVALSEGEDRLAAPGMAIWLIITRAEALQGRDRFALLESSLDVVALAEIEPVSQVPLPASAWLLVTGLLGFFGSKLAPRRAPA